MRIIGGHYRGRKLTSPADKNIRPTSDWMRESIFNILCHMSGGLEDVQVLDVFAGSGALGLEALSRGAAQATFFDKDPKALQLVNHNITLLDVGKITSTICVNAPDLPPAPRRYNVVFLDPPYNLDVISDTLFALVQKDYLAVNSIIIAEYSHSNSFVIPDFFNILKQKTFGNSDLCFLEYIS